MQVTNLPADVLYSEQNITGTAQTQAEESERLTTAVSSSENTVADSGLATEVRSYEDVVNISAKTVNAAESLEDANNEQYSHVHHEALHAYIYGNQRASGDEEQTTAAATTYETAAVSTAETDETAEIVLPYENPATASGVAAEEEEGSETATASEEESEAAATNDKGADGEVLSDEEQEEVQDLQEREQEVIAHENAHKSAGGSLASAPSYDYEQGPDGRSYINDGEVSIDISKESEPEDTISKMSQVKAAALAPAEPSSADRSVAAEATSIASEARQELAAESLEELEESDTETSEEENAATADQSAVAPEDAGTTAEPAVAPEAEGTAATAEPAIGAQDEGPAIPADDDNADETAATIPAAPAETAEPAPAAPEADEEEETEPGLNDITAEPAAQPNNVQSLES